ncbi:hypothetical protein IFM89_029271 [Coptis chinensis]|uniref:Transposase MuDR plant domain-containing protein n=1 Tax=Coptis chinensis TaxID=261450 RepID=A0A835HXW5_9MAGN|nr:hypothetical protein IFM89_029271 [Coptis chinensis]
MEFSVIGVFCYNGGTLSFRFRLDSSIDIVTRKVCDKWPNLGLRSFSMCFFRDAKENLIETDGDLRSLACYYYGMKIATVEIKVNVGMSSMSSCSGTSTSSSLGSSSCLIGGEVVAHKPYKSDFWWRNFDGGVGQRFALGALEFRCKLIKYSIVSGYKYELIKNDDFRVTTVCQKKNELNCQWCIHSWESCGYFEIKKINLTHTCSFAVKEYDHPPLTSYLVKTHILDFARDKPDLTFGDINALYTQLFPLVVGVVNIENDSNWYWFLDMFKKAFGYEWRYTFFSDRHYGLLVNIPIVFPNSYHSFCLWHMENNLKTCLSKSCGMTKVLITLFKKCTYAVTREKFEEHMAEFKEIGGDAISNFLNRAPYEYWANAYFCGARYSEMCSSLAECFNS